MILRVLDIFANVLISLGLVVLGFLIGVALTNLAWQRKVDEISKRLLDTAEEEMMKIYKK